MIDGLVFLDRFGGGPGALRVEIAKHQDPRVAQKWINAVPIDDFIDCVVGDWSIDDPAVQDIASVYGRSWLAAVKAKYGSNEGLSVEVLKDADSGDVIVRLSQL